MFSYTRLESCFASWFRERKAALLSSWYKLEFLFTMSILLWLVVIDLDICDVFYNSMLWTTEWLELLFLVLLGFLCKYKMADETQANEHSLQGFLEFVNLQHFQEGCWFFQCFFIFVERKLEGTNLHRPSDMVAQFYAAPYFLVHKKVWPPPNLHQPTAPRPPSNKWPVP